jgi:pimeloyl-ACP methyl ester carboxylesterase
MAIWYRSPVASPAPETRVAVPTLVLRADFDPFIPATATRRSLEYLDEGEFLELGSGTHWVSGEEPERIGEILREFFSRAAL